MCYRAGLPLRKVVQAHPSSFIRYHKGFRELQTYYKQPEVSRDINLLVITGPSGCFKTTLARLYHAIGSGSVFNWAAGSRRPNGYTDEDEIRIDEFVGESILPGSNKRVDASITAQLLQQLLDWHPLCLRVLFTEKPILASWFSITSNFDPSSWYLDPTHASAVNRRLQHYGVHIKMRRRPNCLLDVGRANVASTVYDVVRLLNTDPHASAISTLSLSRGCLDKIPEQISDVDYKVHAHRIASSLYLGCDRCESCSRNNQTPSSFFEIIGSNPAVLHRVEPLIASLDFTLGLCGTCLESVGIFLRSVSIDSDVESEMVHEANESVVGSPLRIGTPDSSGHELLTGQGEENFTLPRHIGDLANLLLTQDTDASFSDRDSPPPNPHIFVPEDE